MITAEKKKGRAWEKKKNFLMNSTQTPKFYPKKTLGENELVFPTATSLGLLLSVFQKDIMGTLTRKNNCIKKGKNKKNVLRSICRPISPFDNH